MRKLFLAFILLTGIQVSDAQKCFEKGNILLNPGTGLGTNTAGSRFRPSVFFSVDFSVHDYVSVGPYVASIFYGGATEIDFGARGNFHFWQLIDDKVDADLKQDQLELYYTLWLGGEILALKTFGSTANFDIGTTVGLRWYPKANNIFALYGEFGYTPISFATIGATFNLN